jgi:epoxyqueuosine reductase
LRSQIPPDLREGLGDWLFGCDVCQEVCPWNRHSATHGDVSFNPTPQSNPLDLIGLFCLDDTAFRERFRATPLWRAKRRGLLRTAGILLGNRPFPPALPALVAGLNDAESLVREACAWALGRYNNTIASAALRARLEKETDPAVRGEIDATL